MEKASCFSRVRVRVRVKVRVRGLVLL